jgi:hypothetical protein
MTCEPTAIVDDFATEIAALLQHVADTATAIRMHSAYTRQGTKPEDPLAQYDLLWLSDSIHNFDSLGRAIASNEQQQLIDACNELITQYECYGSDSRGFDSKAAFERARRYGVDLSRVITALCSLRDKTVHRSTSEQNLTEQQSAEFNAAINYAVDVAGLEAQIFLSMWREGGWEGLTNEFPDFERPSPS